MMIVMVARANLVPSVPMINTIGRGDPHDEVFGVAAPSARDFRGEF